MALFLSTYICLQSLHTKYPLQYVLSNGKYFVCIFLPHPAGGKAASRVGPKIVLDHVHVYIYMYVYKNYVCALWVSLPLVVYDAIDNASSLRVHED